jgi:hypothetical protein
LEFGGSQQEHSAPSILPAQQFGVVLTGILPSKVTADSSDASCLRQKASLMGRESQEIRKTIRS